MLKKLSHSKEGESLTNLCEMFFFIQRKQNIFQAHREIITSRIDFHPQLAFQYLSRGDEFITRKHLSALMEQNGFEVNEEEVKLVLASYGYKDKLDFNDFLNYLFPSSIESLKHISTVSLKKFSHIKPGEKLSQELLCLILMLLRQEIAFIHQYEILKLEHFPKTCRTQIKKLMKNIRRVAESKSYEVLSENLINFNEIRSFFHKLTNLSQSRVISICRRLSMNKDNCISLDQLQFWLKPWSKLKNEETEKQTKTLFDDIQTSLVLS